MDRMNDLPMTDEAWEEDFGVEDVDEEESAREQIEMALRLASMVMALEVGDVLVRMPSEEEDALKLEIRKPANEEQRAAILAMKTVDLGEGDEDGEEE